MLYCQLLNVYGSKSVGSITYFYVTATSPASPDLFYLPIPGFLVDLTQCPDSFTTSPTPLTRPCAAPPHSTALQSRFIHPSERHLVPAGPMLP